MHKLDPNEHIQDPFIDEMANLFVRPVIPEFSLKNELSRVLNIYKDSRTIIVSESGKEREMRKEFGSETLYNFCSGLLIGLRAAKDNPEETR